ncbi:Uncharacterized protein BM_BM6892 [Brugia malayi]|uniref:CAF1 family ribonuclease containing protein n=1 Tax=Brugia malayi TaxID=6279 RepID=A0A4E9FIN4_BRUMA|nr:Uncharacterized protein BM_BM6892 [Brugia malayi]VIO94710.1 Uncharacterized protein BM_BM6892 [Brugia malayi]
MVINKDMFEATQCSTDNTCCLTSLSKSSFRSRKGYLSNIVVIEVNKENLSITWPYLLLSIRNASFISLDLELSGLGIQKGWLAKSFEERYNVIRQSAQSRSVLSVGIATFQLVSRKETDAKKKLKYKCQVFNILTLCTVPFIVEADGLQFLSKHKFDFNRWINLGIPYGNDTEKGNTVKTLWHEVLCAAVPITLHNGLIDLAFIYQHFYSALPETFSEFVVSVSDWFLLSEGIPGLYDSKYIAEYITRFKASFLEYVFRKCQRENAIEQARNRLYVSIEFDFESTETHLKNTVDIVDCKLPDNFDASASTESYFITDEQKNSLCKRYSVRERRKRRYDYESKLSEPGYTDGQKDKILVSTVINEKTVVKHGETKTSANLTQTTNLLQSVTGCHRAGVDSFMTGFAVVFMQRMNLLRTGNFDPKCGNKMALPGTMTPLVLQKSDYVKAVNDHVAKWTEIERERNRRIELRI